MQIAVIGASGRTGAAFTEQARARGHQVVAVVRNPARLTVEVDRVEEADARSTTELAAAIAGVDAVVFAVGPGPDAAHGIVTESIAATIQAMTHANVRRLLMVSASGPFTTGDAFLLRVVLKPIVQRILRAPFTDLAAADSLVQSSGLDWTIVRPPQLSDGAPKGYRTASPWAMRISRADLATAMLDALDSSESLRRATVVSN